MSMLGVYLKDIKSGSLNMVKVRLEISMGVNWRVFEANRQKSWAVIKKRITFLCARTNIYYLSDRAKTKISRLQSMRGLVLLSVSQEFNCKLL